MSGLEFRPILTPKGEDCWQHLREGISFSRDGGIPGQCLASEDREPGSG